MEFNRISIGSKASINSDIAVVDGQACILAFVSAVGYMTNIREAAKDINYANNVYIAGAGSCKTIPFGYEVEVRKTADSDFSHLVAYRKDQVFNDSNNQERAICYIFSRSQEEFYDRIFDKLSKHLSVPVIREWIPILSQSMMSLNMLREVRVVHGYDDAPFQAHVLNITKQNLVDLVTTGLRTRQINIHGSNDSSDTMEEINGLDNYLNTFGDTLATKIQESFVPKFIPGEQEYSESVHDFDDACFYGGINIFDAQKSVVQAAVNHLNHNDVCFVIGEMGSGKSLIGSGITYAHKKQLGYTAVIMCPSHLVNKWKREVERLVPNGKGYIVKHLKDLIALEPLVKNKAKKENTYIIMSKESAKFGYEYCPSVLWSRSKNAFVCPECGQVLTKKEYVGTGRNREAIYVPFDKTDMSKQYAYNQVCTNSVRYWDEELHIWKEKPCGNKLWKPLNKEDIMDSDWVKLGKEGWIMKRHVLDMFNELCMKDTLTKKETALLIRLEEKKIEIETTGEVSVTSRAPRKFPLASYMKRYWKGYIDYFVADEVHQLKGESAQGYAFADMVVAAKKVICLTGTLLNGYADGLFYILYRTMPRVMLKEGFSYKDEAEFMRAYGVIKRTNRFVATNGRQGDRIGNGSEKRLPGVSPLVFTNFLLDNAVFLSLGDMSEGLPEYTEIPIGIPMDTELRRTYESLETELRSHMGGRDAGKGMKIMSQMLQTLSVYPDMPYNQPPIVHPDTNQVVLTPPSLSDELRAKEIALLDLTQRKVEAGEKVLVYYQWTNRTDTAKKLCDALAERGIKASILEAKVAADKREEWFEREAERGTQVVLCNPTLVETGLDLMEYTSIIFYQIGYNIFTMRQASRRSWRLGQTKPIEVYFMYYENTIQEQALSLMATKLQASMAIEGKFSEEGLRAMSNNEDLLTQIANSVVNGIKETIDAGAFQSVKRDSIYVQRQSQRVRKPKNKLYYTKPILNRLSYNALRKTENIVTPTQSIMKKLFSSKKLVVNLF